MLGRFGLPHDIPAGELPVNDQRALMLAAAYASGASVLFVDEPTAGASHLEAERIAELLRSLREKGWRCSSSSTISASCNASPTGCSSSTKAGYEPTPRPWARAARGATRGLRRLGAEPPRKHLLVVVNAPFSRTPSSGSRSRTASAGSERGERERPAGRGHRLRPKVQTMDSALSPARALANVHAPNEHAIAVVDEGTGIDASWRVARGSDLHRLRGRQKQVDPATRPNVFRIAPTDHGIAFRLAEYLIPKGLKIGLVHDDSDYGTAGGAALQEAFSQNESSVALTETVPANALDLAPQILRARRAHATALVVWGQPATVAAAMTAARSAGWNVPFFTPPSGDDPFVRQQLADHPSWVDGLTFAGAG